MENTADSINMSFTSNVLQESCSSKFWPKQFKDMYSQLKNSYPNLNKSGSVSASDNDSFKKISSTPSTKRKFKYNPFDYNLKERLERPTFSPTVFSTVASPSQDSEFKWTIDDISKINPARIEDESYVDEHVDERTELEIQETINQYFTETHMVLSPFNSKLPTSWRSLSELHKDNPPSSSTAISNIETPYLNAVSPNTLQYAPMATELLLPVEHMSIASFQYSQESEDEQDEGNTSSSSLRRKLFFHTDAESLSPISRFTCDMRSSPMLSGHLRPTSNDVYYPSTPVVESRTLGTPGRRMSPLEISPIQPDATIDKKADLEMEVDTSLREIQVVDSMTSTKINRKTSRPFESPKSLGVRRIKRRRTIITRDVEMQSELSAKMDLNPSKMESQDTGYQTEGFKSMSKNVSEQNMSEMSKMQLSTDWKENKENILIASTPRRYRSSM